MSATPELRPVTYAESVAIDAYRDAIARALDAAGSASDKIAAAAVSVATAYGALIALVAPKDSTQPLVVAIPFAFLAITLALALWAQAHGISVSPTDKVDVLWENVTGVIKAKRVTNTIALVMLALGLVCAGVIVADKYREPAESPSAKAATVHLSRSGSASVAATCGTARDRVNGRVDPAKLGDAWVTIEAPEGCPEAGGSLVLAADAVESVTTGS